MKQEDERKHEGLPPMCPLPGQPEPIAAKQEAGAEQVGQGMMPRCQCAHTHYVMCLIPTHVHVMQAHMHTHKHTHTHTHTHVLIPICTHIHVPADGH